MDLILFAIALVFELVFALVGLKAWFFAFVGAVFGVMLSADVFVNGLTEVYGYSGSEALSRTLSVDTVILVPMFFVVICSFALFVRFRR